MKTVKAEQKSKLPTETPAFTREDVALKLSALDREIKYLLNKAKTWIPKKPKVTIVEGNTTKTADNVTTSRDTTPSDGDGADSTGSVDETTTPENIIDAPGKL